ncbi:C4-dicarboxylate TRAP transporter substrate-binding protein [Aquibacillus sp. 3ASR75-11]|uniref:C4-dicarboxylate TRAP transporter substrate-binding protein n=1 Tax=Terrihalobacillus insolitus TaxID=2950438 RepID=A0A9X3WQJ9_9BACI|nr:C4-dicarboxylate TRAP transporter substrate-binding protein [Terrihalobacillus insolitus]MDC3423420.1 C4-dicarboxylate TRAP transporter substrate-binding protein [Terrihalobacillus insolitus]
MRKFLKVKLSFFAILLLVITVACSSETGTSNSESGEEGSSDKDKTYSINIAFGNQPDEPIGKLASKWKELAEEKSDGRLELKLYPSSQLGAEKDVVEQAVMGNNVIVMAGYDFLMDYVPDVGILTAPYLVDNFDELLYLTETDWFDGIREDLRKENIEIINATTVYGERQLLTNEKVTSPEDLKGMKIRVPDNQMSIKTFDAMGAAATPYPLGELYTALQQGLVNGAENPLPVLQGVKAYEVSKHLSLTGHQKFITSWITGTDFINTIPEELVQILTETGNEAAEYARGVLEEETAGVLEEFKAAGVKVHEVDTAPFKENVQSVYDEFPEWTPGLYDKIQELLKDR